MDRRKFLQMVGAGTAMVMLPSLAAEAAKPEIAAGIPATAAGLTEWMQSTFRVYNALPAAFMEIKTEELPNYGINAKDVPLEKIAVDEAGNPASAKFDHFVMAYGVEGDDPVEAERRLVQMAYEELSKAEAGIPLFLRVEPNFTREKVTEFGDTYMTWEQLQDMDPAKLVIPEGVEQDFATDSLKYVKRKYTLNKLRLRLSLPTLSVDEEMALCIPEGSPVKRI